MMIKRRTLLALPATMALALSAGTAFADGLMDRATGDGLRVAFYNFAPYAYKDDSDTLVGTDVETLSAVLDKMGGKIAEANSTEWGALIPGVKADRFDVVAAGMFVTPKRCAEVQFSEPTFGIQQAMLVLEGNPEGVSNFESVAEKGLKLGAVAGAAQVGYAQTAGIDEANISQLPDNPTGVAALKAGRIDAWAVSAPGVRQIIASDPGGVESTPAFSDVAGERAVSHGAFAFRKDDAEFVAAFNQAMDEFIGSPEHIAILEKHGMTADELPISSTSELCGG
ncbi:transporter substrate-binding domain-containing protein [Ruegeria sp.]|uniref:transporter substrate-binding domain-containing protein n=1 Tax=Ruegeria sp. TaxID=1879320 RepID=UPI00231BF721|nr:transporter substrate-binding domain-containing protein [Ruegeria sp.]MDA7965051.1 transporter substrate-binding domain-containing protein [Ruegeria sp.]